MKKKKPNKALSTKRFNKKQKRKGKQTMNNVRQLPASMTGTPKEPTPEEVIAKTKQELKQLDAEVYAFQNQAIANNSNIALEVFRILLEKQTSKDSFDAKTLSEEAIKIADTFRTSLETYKESLRAQVAIPPQAIAIRSELEELLTVLEKGKEVGEYVEKQNAEAQNIASGIGMDLEDIAPSTVS